MQNDESRKGAWKEWVEGRARQQKQYQETQQSIGQAETTVEFGRFWRRFFALLIDVFILGILVQVLSAGLSAAGIVARSIEIPALPDFYYFSSGIGRYTAYSTTGAPDIGNLVGFLVVTAYFIVAYSTVGRTLGKWLLRIRVASTDGSRLTWWKGITRTVCYLPSSIFFIGFLWSVWDRQKQGWHDKAAGTVVVRTSVSPEELRMASILQKSKIAWRVSLLTLAIVAILGVSWFAVAGSVRFGDLRQVNTEVGKAIPALEGVRATLVNADGTRILVVTALVKKEIISDEAEVNQLEQQIAVVAKESYPNITNIDYISVAFYNVKTETRGLIWSESESSWRFGRLLPIEQVP